MTLKTIDYEEARNFIKDGDIVFIRDKSNLVGWIVRLFTFSRYSHVGIAFWALVGGKRRLFMVEAQGGSKRRIVNMSYYDNQRLDIISAPVKWSAYVDRAMDRLGKVKYGWFDAIYVGLRESLMKTTKFIKLPRFNLSGEICSEFVARMLDLPKKQVSPQLLLEQLEEAGHTLSFRVQPR